jgi:5-hydroxyisourate hydrolase-like protein (transthyretin family)
MSPKRRINFLSVSLWCFLLFAPGASAQQFQLIGRVVDAETQRPLPRVWVGLYTAHSLLAWSWTNQDGRFEMRPLERDLGAYYLEIRADEETGYPVQHRKIQIDRWDEIQVRVEMQRTGFGPFSVEGRILDEETGAPVDGVWVGLYEGSELVARVFSNPGGEYKLPYRGKLQTYQMEIKPVLKPYRERRLPVEVRQSGVIQKDLFLQPLPTGASLPKPEIVLEIDGRLLIKKTTLPVSNSTITLLQNSQKISTAFARPDGRFELEVPGIRPGFYILDIDAWNIFLEDIQIPLQVENEDIRNLEIAVPSRLECGLTKVNLTGEVFSAGGGRGMGWVAVYLLYQNYPLHKTWTNDFGRYEMRQVIVPHNKCRIVFFPQHRAFFPVVREVDFSNNNYQSVSVTLPALVLNPSVRQQASGRIENQFPGGPGAVEWTLLFNDFPAFRTKSRGEYYFWEADLPRDQYHLHLSSRSGLETGEEQAFPVKGGRLSERVELLTWSRKTWTASLGIMSFIVAGGIVFLVRRHPKYN